MRARRVGATLICVVAVVVGTMIAATTMTASTITASTIIATTTTPTTTTPTTTAQEAAVRPDTSLRPRAKVANATVSGRARGFDGAASRHVHIGFKKVTCPRCAPMTVVTDDEGAYAVSVPLDTYVVGCTAGRRICTVAGSEELVDTVTVRSATTLDLSVQVRAPTSRARSSTGSAVYGRVRTTGGLPVADATIELVAPHQRWNRLFTDTGADGSYRLAAGAGGYLVACITPLPDYECGPVGGNGDPYSVQVGVGLHRVEFRLCPSRNYPGCLSR